MTNQTICILCLALLNGVIAVPNTIAQVMVVPPNAGRITVAPAKNDDAKIKVDVIAGNDDANLDPAEREIRNRLQPVLKRELAFAERVCKLDKPQRKTLAEAGQEAVKKAAYQYSQAQRNGGGQGQFVVFNGGRNVAQPNPIKMLQIALQDSAKDKLPPELLQLLNDEFAKRAEYRKQASIDNLIVVLDKKLGLTEKQRGEISESLAAAWDDAWATQLQTFAIYNQDLIPRFPDKCITPHLQPAQKTVWDNMPNKNIQFGFDVFEVDPLIGGVTDNSDSDDDP
ncbi:MAG TPA: hypothetical protein VGI75_00815 [Pirellulales bacterium]